MNLYITIIQDWCHNNNNDNNRIQRRYLRFFTISSQRRELSPTCTRKCRVTCHLVRRDSSAIKFDRVEIAFI